MACAALLAFTASAADPVKAIVKFKMTWSGIPIAEATDTLEFKDGRYKITSEAVAIGLAKALGQPPIDRYSEGTYDESGFLSPERYEHVRDGKSRISVIDREAGVVRINTEGVESTEEITLDAIHDNLTLAYNFYALGEALPAGKFHLTDGKRMVDIDFVAVGEEPETVETGMGRIEAYKFERLTDKPGRKYLIWYAKDARLMPAIYVSRRDSSEISFILQSVEFIDS